MTYSLDLRTRVVNYVNSGKSIAQAARVYEIGKSTVHRWLNRKQLAPTVVKRRHRKMNWKELEAHVKQCPDATHRQRAEHFGVKASSICYALKQMKITRKKNNCSIKKESISNESNFSEKSET